MNTYDENNVHHTDENVNYSENTTIQEEKLLFGAIGAFLGSLIGVALWVFIYNAGYIASISGFIMIICSIKGYEFFAGSLSKKGIIITLIINIFMVYAAMHLSFALEIYNAYKDIYYITIFDSIRSVPDFISETSEIKSVFFKDLALGYLFTFAGAFSTVKNLLSEDR